MLLSTHVCTLESGDQSKESENYVPEISLLHSLNELPKILFQISGASVGEVKIVTDMHERKAEMARQADAFIALPGMHDSTCSSPTLLIMPFQSGNAYMASIVLIFNPTCLHGNLCTSGGYGTMEELLEMITWSQLGIHEKPVSISILLQAMAINKQVC